MKRIGSIWVALFVLAAAVSLNSCRSNSTDSDDKPSSKPKIASWFTPKVTVPAGTLLSVRLTSGVSSKTAGVGDSWSGVLARPTFVVGKEVLPEGSEVHGVVVAAREARQGSRAMLDLEVRRIQAKGNDVALDAGTEAVVAGSARARNLGAVAGGAAAGAIIGKVVGGEGRDAALGAMIGATAAGVAVSQTKGYQVELNPGAVLTFTVSEPVAVVEDY